jgi:serine/threonine protein kinase
MNEPTQAPWLSDTASATLRDRYIPQYCLGRKAGRQTWLATDRVTGAAVVVKRLVFGRDFLWDDLKLFEREAQTLKSIDHPAIPRYLDFFDLESEGEQGFALVQSYIDARSLEEHVKSGRRFSEADLKKIAIQILEILDYLHHCQPPVIHRDIKPSNILLAESDVGVGLVYLVDFGSVQSLAAREGSTITIVGTYGYMPPEQFGGRAYPTSDFYSLGATLIYLATGKHPADIPQGKDLRLNFEPLANLSLEMTEWIREMIHPLADERPNSARSAVKYLSNPLPKSRPGTSINPQAIAYPRPNLGIVRYAVSDDELNFKIPANCIYLVHESGGLLMSTGLTIEEKISENIFFLIVMIMSPAIFSWIVIWEVSSLFMTCCIGSFFALLASVWIAEKIQGSNSWTYLNLKDKYLTIDWDKRCRYKNPNLRSSIHEILRIRSTSYSQGDGNGGVKDVSCVEIKSNDVSIRIEIGRDESRWLAAELGAFLKLPVSMSG